ncbi:MAG: DUF6178 family protein, partial [Kofleriaceae bacterium]
VPGRVLARVIDHIGLEDASELIALATTDQLEQVFDEDLWRSSRPGRDEQFDAARFVLWLEVMLEAGETFTANRLAELPEDLIVSALHHHVLVVDLDEMAVEIEHEDGRDYIEKALDSHLHVELDHYRVLARDSDGWDAIAAALLALDRDHHDVAIRLLDRCCALSGRDAEDNGGLYNVLTSEQMLAGDLEAARQDRRAAVGFIAPSSARAFLRGAATTDVEVARSQERDAITRAYFRELEAEPLTAAPDARPLLELLQANGILEDAAPATRALTSGPQHGLEAAFRDALLACEARDPDSYQRRMAELAFLANVLVAGADPGDRAFRPSEAAAAVLAACGVALEHLSSMTRTAPATLVASEPADRLFRIGWRLLSERHGNAARALATMVRI